MEPVSISSNAPATSVGQQLYVRQQARDAEIARKDSDEKAADKANERASANDHVSLSSESRQLAEQSNRPVQRPEDAARSEEDRRTAREQEQSPPAPQSVARALEAYTRTALV